MSSISINLYGKAQRNMTTTVNHSKYLTVAPAEGGTVDQNKHY